MTLAGLICFLVFGKEALRAIKVGVLLDIFLTLTWGVNYAIMY